MTIQRMDNVLIVVDGPQPGGALVRHGGARKGKRLQLHPFQELERRSGPQRLASWFARWCASVFVIALTAVLGGTCPGPAAGVAGHPGRGRGCDPARRA